MTPETVVTVIQRAMEVMVLLGGPLLLTALVVGLVVSIFQAATQINEASLSFIPKLLITFLVFILIGPWMIETAMDYTIRLFQSIPQLIG
ncbi:flagellar biosynthesis protein FliQ [Iodobacter sp. LRB]|uniref:Flagellar biosynthetic protein FliQ n=3 Tax=Iodobacter TaxID=32014 RepID=A0A3S8ZWU2_9NEIS|nr:MULTISPECIES: flagellar biosynthesis protein FliQ [Iodobacter]AZN37939.1 flagellar biosynthetic protein FliQ [Iodobacter ciconiae]NHQ85862.1 flagellar biosynthesis protein FliQ [Iodobacter violacea]PHV00987.1 flagellar biosynthetic protein FliQ [Iodobacter sp. BJB302]TCU88095.1 flagellar biosynthetic protein FliQ [Iodobacter fluviatilis]STR45596.1 Flagellar biosynthetic protein FliQ [Iodobacter fluviatilis]